jgi:hypothetical protein
MGREITLLQMQSASSLESIFAQQCNQPAALLLCL